MSDDEIRAQPAFAQLYRVLHTTELVFWTLVAPFMVCCVLFVFEEQRWAIVPGIVLAVANGVAQLRANFLGSKLMAAITADQTTQRRAWTLAMGDARPRFAAVLMRPLRRRGRPRDIV